MIKGFVVIVLSIGLFHPSNACAQEKVNLCKDSSVVVSYTKMDDYYLACDSVNLVIEVAKKIGLSGELKVSIAFVESLSINHMGQSLAMFNPGTLEIQMLSMAECKKRFGNEVVLGQEINKELYRSILIHELAHVLFWQNKGKTRIGREVHEYFAYVIQLALLNESLREQIIFSGDVPAFSNRSEITEEYYLLNPTRFAVKSYLHFLNVKEGWPYLLSLFKE